MHGGVGGQVLVVEQLHSGNGGVELLFEEVYLRGGRREDVGHRQRVGVDAGGLHGEPEGRVGLQADQQARRYVGELDLPALLLGERLDEREDDLLGGVEPPVGVDGVHGAEQGGVARLIGGVFGPRRRGEVVDALVEPAGVIALHEVLGHDLPVERQVGHGGRVDGHHVLDVEVGHRLVEAAQPGRQRLGPVVEVDEDETLPHLGAQPRQPDVGLVEPVGPVHVGRADQAAVEVVGPPVVRAAEGVAVARGLRRRLEPLVRGPLGRGGDAHGPVLAHRAHHVHLAGLVASHDEGLAGHGGGVEVARVGYLVGPADAYPLPLVDGLHLEVEEPRVGIGGGRQPDDGGEIPRRAGQLLDGDRRSQCGHGVLPQVVPYALSLRLP